MLDSDSKLFSRRMRYAEGKSNFTLDITFEENDVYNVTLKKNLGKGSGLRTTFLEYSDVEAAATSCCIHQCMALDLMLALVLIQFSPSLEARPRLYSRFSSFGKTLRGDYGAIQMASHKDASVRLFLCSRQTLGIK